MDRNTDLGTVVKHSKVEIAPSDIGRTIDAEQLQDYDPRCFQVVLFPRDKRTELREYLKVHAYPYLRVGPTSALLVPNEFVDELQARFEGRVSSVHRSFDGSQWPPAEP